MAVEVCSGTRAQADECYSPIKMMLAVFEHSAAATAIRSASSLACKI